MKIKQAKDEKSGKIYDLKDLLQLPDDSDVLKRLVCVHCGCLLTLCHATADKVAYLKTKNGQTHDVTCADYFGREERKVLEKTGKIVNGRLSTTAMSSRLKRMQKRLFSPEENEDPMLRSNPQGTPSSGVTTAQTKRKSVTQYRAIANPDAEDIEGESSGHVRVKYREIGQLSMQDLGEMVLTGGYLKQVVVSTKDEEHASLVLEFKKRTIALRLYPDIFQYQQGLYRRMCSLHAKVGLLDHQVEVVAAVEIGQDADGELEARLRSESDISFDNRRLTVFLSLAN